MKKYLSITLACLFIQLTWAQSGEGYDPQNPGDPQVYYRLMLEASPKKGGIVSPSSMQQLTAGTTININASASAGYKFKQWMVGDKVVSTESSFTYTMPEENVTLIAYFDWSGYDPESPGDPFADGYQHKVTLYATPSIAGSFNSSSFYLSEGKTTNVYAYPNSGYRFVSWKQNGKIVSTKNPMEITMGTENLEYTAQFVYDPQNPANPGANNFNAATGELVIDDFEAGRLSDAISNTLGEEDNYNKVKSITIIGAMQAGDFGFLRRMTNCSVADISRTTGYSNVPDYAFEGASALKTLILPYSVESIGSYAFSGCSNLTTLYCYATTPPSVSSTTFDGVPSSMKVLVPALSLELYQSASYWKDFVLSALDGVTNTLTISLPEDAKDGRYKNMTLELDNITSGQVSRLLITDRTRYSFVNLIHNTKYNVYVKNSVNAVLGEINGIEIKEEDVTTKFQSLLQPQNVTVSVVTPEGEDVTDKVDVTWYDVNGTYLYQSPIINGFVEGTKLQYKLKMSHNLLLMYVQPSDSTYTLLSAGNDIRVTLNPITEIEIEGYVKNTNSKLPVYGASVSITQQVNGKQSKTQVVKTDAKGYYTAKIFNAPASITYNAFDFVNLTKEVSTYEIADGKAKIEDALMSSIVGATVNVSLTYQESVVEGETPEVQNWYADYANVTYSVFNETTGKEITQISNRYPQLVLMEGVSVGDKLKLTAKSKKDAFEDVVVEAVVDSMQLMDVTFPIKQLGGFTSSFVTTKNDAVVGILFNKDGYMIKKYDYSTAQLHIEGLASGEYKLITMTKNDAYNSIYRLSRYADMGLVENTDYILCNFNIENGVISAITIDNVPFFNEAKLNEIDREKSSLYVNNSTIVAGNYLTITSTVEFINKSSSDYNHFNLIFDIPESAHFVNGSVMRGSEVVNDYTLDGNTLIVPFSKDANKIKFCVIPTEKGTYSPNAIVRFIANNEDVVIPIGSVNYSVENITINVPNTVAQKDITVSGSAEPGSTIEIYDGDVIINKIQCPAGGNWFADCKLNEAYNLSTHNIYAKVITTDGASVVSESKNCIYNINEIFARSVDMSFYNGWLRKNVEVTFDLENLTNEDNSYMFYTATDITFAANLSNNDTTIVKGVTIGVYTDRNEWINLKASYDANSDRWVAVNKFDSYNLPIGVKVDIEAKQKVLLDYENLSQNQEQASKNRDEYVNSLIESDSLLAIINSELNVENPNINYINELLDKFNLNKLYTDENSFIFNMDSTSFDNYLYNLSDSLQILINSVHEEQIEDLLKRDRLLDYFYVVEGMNTHIMISIPYTTDKNTLIRDGYKLLETVNGQEIYEKFNDNCLIRIDIERNECTTIQWSSPQKNNSRAASWDNIKKKTSDILAFLSSKIADCKRTQVALKNFMLDLDIKYDAQYKEFAKQDKNIAEALKRIENEIASSSGFKKLALAEKRIELLSKRSVLTVEWNNLTTRHALFAKSVGFAIDKIFQAVTLLYNETQAFSKVNSLDVPECLYDKNPALAQSLEYEIEDLWQFTYEWYCWTAARIGIYALADIALSETVVLPIVLSIVELGGEMYYATQKEAEFDSRYNFLSNKISRCAKECDKCPICKKSPCECKCKKCGKYPCECKPKPEKKPVHDPSGFVYEGVFNNRVEGVTATCFYKETVEDMYGDLHDNVVKWDAEEYGQENPLHTDKDGFYQWFVPEGLWQVKYEKEGYETAYSEWLPVPPPQLDVNIGIVQNRQPEVKEAHAYEDGVELTFDKYMMPAYLTTENIKVSQNGKYVEGKVVLVDEEVAYRDENVKYASTIRFVPIIPFTANKEVTLVVANRVKSYAGIQMAENFTQSFDIEKEVKSILADSLVKVPYQGSKVITLYVQPADAAVGKTMNAESSSEMIASLVQKDVVIDDNGMAQFEIKGELPGTTGITFRIDGVKTTATVIANVGEFETSTVSEPKASLVSGSSVYRGTKVELTADSKDLKIWYTTDGTCPCDENGSRKQYTEPIAINSDMTLKAMAENADGDASEVVTFIYSILQSKAGVALNNGWTWISLNMKNDALSNVNTALASGTWTSADEIKDDRYTDSYSASQKKWIGTLSNHGKLTNTGMYKVHSSMTQNLSLAGEAVHPAETTVTVVPNWNYIGYTPLVSMSVADAMTGYDAKDGDVLKSQDAFATYSNARGWEGDLTTMEAGKGYMLKRNASAGQTSFTYPLPSSGTRSYDAQSKEYSYKYADNMNIVGLVSGINVHEGDSIIAYVQGEYRGGNKILSDGRVYLTLMGDEDADVTLVLSRDGEIISTSSSLIEYKNNKVMGTAMNPTAITFIEGDNSGEIGKIKTIYSLNGMNCGTRNISKLPIGVYLIYSALNNKTKITKYIKR